MSDFKAKMHQIRFPLGELTALPQTPKLDLRGLTSRGGEGERRGKGGEERKEEEGGRGGEGPPRVGSHTPCSNS